MWSTRLKPHLASDMAHLAHWPPKGVSPVSVCADLWVLWNRASGRECCAPLLLVDRVQALDHESHLGWFQTCSDTLPSRSEASIGPEETSSKSAAIIENFPAGGKLLLPAPCSKDQSKALSADAGSQMFELLLVLEHATSGFQNFIVNAGLLGCSRLHGFLAHFCRRNCWIWSLRCTSCVSKSVAQSMIWSSFIWFRTKCWTSLEDHSTVGTAWPAGGNEKYTSQRSSRPTAWWSSRCVARSKSAMTWIYIYILDIYIHIYIYLFLYIYFYLLIYLINYLFIYLFIFLHIILYYIFILYYIIFYIILYYILYYIILYFIILYIILYYILYFIWYYIIFYFILYLHYIILYFYIILYNILYYIILNYILYHIILYYTILILYYIILYDIILYDIILYNIILYYNIYIYIVLYIYIGRWC